MEKAEKIGLGIATAGHVLLFGALSAGFLNSPDPLKLRTPPLEVAFVDELALESMAPKISQDMPPPSEAPEQGPTEEAQAAPAPASMVEPEPAPAPLPPKPAPAKREVVKAPPPKPTPPKASAAPRPAPTKAKTNAKPAPKAAEGKKPAPRSTGSNLGANFLDGLDSDKPTRVAAAAPPAAKMGPADVASLNAEIYRQLKPHWKPPSGADAELLRTQLSVRLNKDGSLAERPEIVTTTGVNDSNRAQVSLHQERAVQAVLRAAPFRNLPHQFYQDWKWLKPLNFDGRLSR